MPQMLMYFSYLKRYRNKYALNIMRTSLETLELTGLSNIQRGSVLVFGNTNLCYASSIHWPMNPEEQRALGQNRAQAECRKLESTYSMSEL